MRSLVVLPTYNEIENLDRIIPAILNADPTIEVLVVDDNSPDGTGALAEKIARAEARVQVLHRPGKQGLGTAYLAGFDYALRHDYEAIFEMDADFSHDPADLPYLLAPIIADEADLTIGSRWAPGGDALDWPLCRRLLSRGGSFYARAVLGLPLRDLTGGFKCFHRSVLEAIDPGGVRAGGYGFQIELTWLAAQAGFRIQELPIIFRERERGQSKMSGDIVAEAAALVWKLRFAPPVAAPPAPVSSAAQRIDDEEPLLELEVGA